MARTPKYRRRPDRDTAFVEVGGRRMALPGKADSPESLAAYHKIVQEVLTGRLKKRPIRKPAYEIAVSELVEAYLDFAKLYYLKNGLPGGEYHNCRHAFRPLLDIHGGTLVEDFGPIALKEVRQKMVESGLSRRVVNARVKRIQRAFRWGVENEIVDPVVSQAIQAVAGLRKGKTVARERPEVRPVDRGAVDAILPHLTPVLAAMVQIQQITGMRSENLCLMRPCDIDRSADVWLYRPPQHKGEHLDRELIVPLGPRCQAILTPFLDRDPEAFCFSPRESELQRRQANRRRATTPRVGDHKPRESIRTHYNPRSYRRAIWYALRRINASRSEEAAKQGKPPPEPLAHWHPHQLRHSVATEIRRRYKAEAARVFLGHSHLKTTEIYAEADLELARKIAREMG